MAMTDDEIDAWMDKNVPPLREYCVIVHCSDGSGFTFPLLAANEQDAYAQFDACYLQLQNSGQVFPYAVQGSRMNMVIKNAREIQLLDYFTENVIAAYGVRSVA